MQRADDIALALTDRAALLEIQNPDGGGLLPIAMPDIAPPWGADEAPDRYLSVSIFDNVPRWQSVGGGSKLGQGILQVEVIGPRGTGVVRPRSLAEAVMGHFPMGLRLVANTAAVKVSGEPWHGSLIPSAAGSSIPVSIPWIASASRTGAAWPGPGENPSPEAGNGYYDHVQTSASIIWVVNHNLGYRPSATVLSPGGAEVFATVEHQSANQLRVYFNEPATGSVHCV